MLIREGATLVQSADDVLELIRHFDDRAESILSNDERSRSCKFSDFPETGNTDFQVMNREPLFNLLSVTPVTIDELVRQSGLSLASVQFALLELELAGRLDRHAGARVSWSE